MRIPVVKKMNKPSDKTIAMIEDIFEQGDSRYNDEYSATIVASFVENEAIKIEKSSIRGIKEPSEDELKEIGPPQSYYKFFGKKWLEIGGYKLIGFEIPFSGCRADILAKHTSKNETVAVECCSCATEKAIEYLKNKNTVLWVLSLSENPYIDNSIPLFIIKRGPNWDKYLKLYNQSMNEILKKIPDLLASL